MAATYTFDSVNGSDTQASGYAQDATLAAAPAHGTAGAYSSVTGFFSISSEYPSGVLATIGDKIWVSTGSGRQWFTINDGGDSGAGSKSFSFAESFTAGAGPFTWGYGGSRKTLAGSLQLGADIEAGETILGQPLPTSGQTQTLTSGLTLSATGSFTSGGITFDGNGVTITSATNSVDLLSVSGTQWALKNMTLTSTAATRGNGIVAAATIILNLTGVLVNGCSHAFRMSTNSSSTFFFTGVEVKNCTASDGFGAISLNGNFTFAYFAGCWVHDNANSDGVSINNAGTNIVSLFACEITNNGSNGINQSNASANITLTVRNCLFAKNGGKSISLSSTGAVLTWLANNLFLGAGSYHLASALSASGAAAANMFSLGNNAFGLATSGNYLNWQPGTADITGITSAVVNNYAANDFTLNQAQAAAQGLVNTAWPQLIMGQASKSSIGAVQFGVGGGGALGLLY